MRRVLIAVLIFLPYEVTALLAQAPPSGKNTVVIRGVPQDVYCYPAEPANRSGGAVLYFPGDGGWRGFAVDMVKAMASFGYNVCAWDTKQYLSGFTGTQGALKESNIMADSQAIARWMTQGRPDKVTLSGWSEGASLALLAAASPDRKSTWRGLVAVGLPDYGFLGWRLADNLTYITKKHPDEPRFDTLPYLSKVAPLPSALIYSMRDEYVSQDQAKRLFGATGEPKRIFTIDARNHRYDGNQADFFKSLREALAWIHTPR